MVGAFGDPRMTQNSLEDANLQEPSEIVKLVSSICPDEADAIVLSSSAWRAMEAAAEIERLTGTACHYDKSGDHLALGSKGGHY